MKSYQPELQSDYLQQTKSDEFSFVERPPQKTSRREAPRNYAQKKDPPERKGKTPVREEAPMKKETPKEVKKPKAVIEEMFSPKSAPLFGKAYESDSEPDEEEEPVSSFTSSLKSIPVAPKFGKPSKEAMNSFASSIPIAPKFGNQQPPSNFAGRQLPMPLMRELHQFRQSKLKDIRESAPLRPFIDANHSLHSLLSPEGYHAVARMALDAGGKEWRRSMFMLVGEGRAGKTAVLNALMGRSFTQTASTVGIEACEVKVTGVQSKWGSWSEYDIGEVKQAELAQAEMASKILADPQKRTELQKLHPLKPKSVAPSPPPPPPLSTPFPSLSSSNPSLSPPSTVSTSSNFSFSKYYPSNWLKNPTTTTSSSSSSRSSSPASHSSSPFTLDATTTTSSPPRKLSAAATVPQPSPLDLLSPSEASVNPSTSISPPLAPPPPPERDDKFPSPIIVDNKVPLIPSKSAEEELTKKLDQELVVQLMKQGRATEEAIVFSAWDYGGQEVFYSLHHLFLSRYGVYLVCFNMEWLIPSAPVEQAEQCLAYLTFWLNSIAVHTRDAQGNFAPALLVGTHKDVVSSPAQHEAISNRLFAALEDNQVFRSSVFLHDRGRVATGRGQLWFFPVDNRLGRGDIVIQEIMGAIESIVSTEEYIHQKVPLSWLKVYDSLQTKSKSAPFVSLKDMLTLASECGVPAKASSQSLEQETRDMLSFFSGLGIVMYHDEPGLRDVVVLDPAAYLVGPATLIIREHKIHPPPERARKSPLWRKLTKDSLLDSGLVPLLWEDVEPQQQEILLTLLVKFGLLVPLLRESSSMSANNMLSLSSPSSPTSASSSPPLAPSRLYLVPSLLRSPSATEQTHLLQLVPPDATERPLSFRIFFAVDDEVTRLEVLSQTLLSSGFLPNGLFARVLGKCVSWSQSTSSFQPRLFKDKALMCFGEHLFTIESVPADHSILVCIHPAKINPRLVMERLRELVLEVIRECMPQLVFCLLVAGSAITPGHLVNLDRLADSIAQGKQIFIDSRKLSTEDVYSEYRIWLPQQGIPDRYDVFVASALHGADAQLSGKLFHCLSLCDNGVRPIDTFWDRQCLVNGRRVPLDPAQALSVSLVAVPLVSVSALEALGQPEGQELLFEWVLAIELHAAGIIKHIMPLCVDISGPDKDTLLAKLPSIPPSASLINRVRTFLKSKSVVASRELETRIVRDVVIQLLALPHAVDAPVFMAHRQEEWERLPTAFASVCVSQCVRPAFQLVLQETARSSADSHKAKVLSHADIDWIEKVGGGIASEVWRCRWHSTEVAVKVMKNQSVENKAEFDKEVEVNTRLPFHERMVPMNGIVTDPKMCIVLKYLPRLSVEDYVIKGDRLSAPSDFTSALSITVDASAGITHLHSEGCVHRDIACRNFLLDEHLRAYVCDFGLSKYLSNGQNSGTGIEGEMVPFRWMSPESLLARTYSKASDVYMFGMFLYELFARNAPFKADLPGASALQIRAAVLRGERPTLPNHWPKELKDIILSCWREDPLMRPTMTKINDKLVALLQTARVQHIKLAPGLPKELIPIKAQHSYSDANPSEQYVGYVQTPDDDTPSAPPLTRVVSSIRTMSEVVDSSDTSVYRLSETQLTAWLQERELEDVAQLLHQHSVDGQLLKRLSATELLQLGLSSLQCKRLLAKLPGSLEQEVRELRGEVATLKSLLLEQHDLLSRIASKCFDQTSTYISSLSSYTSLPHSYNTIPIRPDVPPSDLRSSP